MPTSPIETRPKTIVDTGAALAGLDATPFGSGDLAFVESTGTTYELRRDLSGPGDGFDTISVGPGTGNQGLWVRACFSCTGSSGPTSPTGPLIVGDIDTSALTPADIGKAVYIDAAGVAQLTDAAFLFSSLAVGFYEGVPGEIAVGQDIVDAQMTAVGGAPVNGAIVYLANAASEAGAAGKLTATAPTVIGEVVMPVGNVLDASGYPVVRLLINIGMPTQL